MPQVAHRVAYPRLSVLPGGQPAGERMAAVIDLGSNSWRLVVYAYVPGASWRRVGQLQEAGADRAKGSSGSGSLNPDAMARGLEALEMFGRYLHARGVPNEAVDAVATSAIRDADNGADLLALAQERTGLSISVLSAEEEARLGLRRRGQLDDADRRRRARPRRRQPPAHRRWQAAGEARPRGRSARCG